MMFDDIEDVKVIHRGDPKFIDQQTDEQAETSAPRSRAQEIRDGILDDVEHMLREARDLIDEALEQFTLLAEPQHKNLGMLVGQQIEQVIEFRRVRQ